VLDQLRVAPGVPQQPLVRTRPAVTLVADVSGFTASTEALVQAGPEGVEQAKRGLDGFFGALVDQVHSHAGDVLKFAGDGLLACWDAGPDSGGTVAAVQRAGLCALASQVQLRSARPEGVEVRMMIGAGDLRTELLGGTRDRWELAVGGDSITQLDAVEPLSRPDQVVVSPAAVEAAGAAMTGELSPGGALRLRGVPGFPGLPRKTRKVSPSMAAGMASFIPRAMQATLGSGYEEWTAELRPVSVLFVHLPELDGTAWDQAAIQTLQEQLYRHEGSLNKLGPDPRGVMALLAFGLPPLAHEEDPLRAVRTAVAVQRTLSALGRSSSVGVATGRAFCGIVGTEERCEYTLIGDVVNLAARLAQAAHGGVLVDTNTVRRCRGRAAFTPLEPIELKGKRQPVPIYTPC